MRAPLLAAAALAALAAPTQAQTAGPASADVAVRTHPDAVYVVPAGPGEAVRVTTYARRPTVGERLDRYRGVRVFRDGAAGGTAVWAVPAARVQSGPDGRWVRQGGASYPVARR